MGSLSPSISHQHPTQAAGGLLLLCLGDSVGVALLNGGAPSGQPRQEAIEGAPTWFRVSCFGIRDPGSGIRDPGSGIRGFRDPGVSGFGVRGSGFGVRGLGFGVRGSGFGVRGFGFRVSGSRFRVWGLGSEVWGLGFGVWSLGFGAWGLGLGFGVWGSGSWVRGCLGLRVEPPRCSARRGSRGRCAAAPVFWGIGVSGLGLRFGIEGLGVGIWGLEFGVRGLGVEVRGLGFTVDGSGCGVQG